MNTEFRNKILNRYVESAEKENTQEREGYLQALEKVDEVFAAMDRQVIKVLLQRAKAKLEPLHNYLQSEIQAL